MSESLARLMADAERYCARHGKAKPDGHDAECLVHRLATTVRALSMAQHRVPQGAFVAGVIVGVALLVAGALIYGMVFGPPPPGP